MATTLRFQPALLPPSPSPRGGRGPRSIRLLAPVRRVEGLRLRDPTVLSRGRQPSTQSFRASDSIHGDAVTAEEEPVAEEVPVAEEGTVAESVDNDTQPLQASEPASPEPVSGVMALLQSYKAAVAANNLDKMAEIESSLESIQDEKDTLAAKIALLSLDLTTEKDRVLRISADFENYRRRTEKERLSLMTNVQGEVVEKLLPVLDNFERAKDQIKVETEGEEKISSSYQSIYKQFCELLKSLRVKTVETVGRPFDPMLHEAIMRDESTEFEEGIVMQEFRKGYNLDERLLRAAMVKVSAGPGPAKRDDSEAVLEEVNNDMETSTEETS